MNQLNARIIEAGYETDDSEVSINFRITGKDANDLAQQIMQITLTVAVHGIVAFQQMLCSVITDNA